MTHVAGGSPWLNDGKLTELTSSDENKSNNALKNETAPCESRDNAEGCRKETRAIIRSQALSSSRKRLTSPGRDGTFPRAEAHKGHTVSGAAVGAAATLNQKSTAKARVINNREKTGKNLIKV